MNKKNKHINLISLFSIILIFVVLFIWCYKTLNKSDKSGGNEVNLDNDYYLVSFDSNGGDGIFDDQKVLKDGFAVRPISEPIYEGYIFLGWYLNLDDVTEFNFNEPIISNIELIAKWEKVNVETYLVKFDSNGGESVDSVLVNAGNNVTMPIPTRKWYDFVSWKLNGKDYNFNTPVTDNIALVADWKVSSTIVLVNGVDLIPNTTAASAIKNNTIMLQRVIDLVSDNFSSGTSINKMQMALYLYNFNNL